MWSNMAAGALCLRVELHVVMRGITFTRTAEPATRDLVWKYTHQLDEICKFRATPIV